LSANTHTFTGSIVTSGSIGINGTPDNTYQGLTIVGSNPSLRLKGTQANSWTWIEFVSSSGANNFSMGVNHTTPYFGIKAGAGMDTPNFAIASSGNVGIGTSSPSSQLNIVGLGSNIFTDGLRVTRTSGTNQYGVVNYKGGSLNLLAVDTIGSAPEIDFLTSTDGSTSTVRMVILPSGNVGIGTTSPTANLHINAGSGLLTKEILIVQGGGSPSGNYGFSVQANNGDKIFYTDNLTYHVYGALNGGKFCMNTTTAAGTLNLKAQSDNRAIFLQNPNGGDGSIWLYGASNSFDYKFSTWSQGSAFYLYNNGNYSFAGSNVSDRRLKENIELITYNAIEKIMQLVPKSYNMIAQPEINRNGFIAQEVKEILPDIITGTETDEEYLGLDYNGLLAVAIKAIQELKADNDAIRAELAALKS
jgi:hypothetical protein